MTARRVLAAIAPLIVSFSAGCATVGKDYQRPAITLPSAVAPPSAGQTPAAAESLALQPWSAVFADDALRDLIAAALAHNLDLRVAAARLQQVEATYGITRSAQFPSIDAQAVAQGQRSSVGRDEASTGGVVQLGASASWEIDFWGRYRRATEAARAEILATRWGQRAVIASVVARVASGYHALRSLDAELAIAERTLGSREESLRLTEVRERGGATSLVDVRQAEQLVYGARAAITDLRSRIAQQEHALSVLVGQLPGPITRAASSAATPALSPVIPAGLPSDLLEQRPDVQQAEQLIVAANADVGVARANYFPRISLTGSGGVASSALSALFSGPALAWTAAASAVQPLFNAGRTRSQVALAEARREEAEAVYQQTIQQAFRDVADALVDFQRARELRDTRERLVVAARDAQRLAQLRYEGGVASYLEVLDSDTRLFAAELDLVRTGLDEQQAFVDAYRALGGGWRN